MIFLEDHLLLSLVDGTLDGFGLTKESSRVYFRDANTYISSPSSGVLGIVCTTLSLTGTFSGASLTASTLTNSTVTGGTVTGAAVTACSVENSTIQNCTIIGSGESLTISGRRCCLSDFC